MIANKLQRTLEVFTAFLFLNLLWILFCLPIITIYPSTLALFHVVREWKTTGIDYEIGKLFISSFKKNFADYFWVGIIWLGLGTLLIIDFFVLFTTTYIQNGFVVGLLFFGTFFFIGMTVYLFPITVNFRLSKKSIVKNAFLFTIGKLGTTISVVLLLASLLIICYFVPYLLWIVGSVAAFFSYTIISGLNQQLWNKTEEEI
ncbi:YesL family protein [Bacillus suaedae]|uniref:DUF624 domain-containing protein n=1 Tax=Halalkalibacter suaedae TaxID=2822140 RepID=A0A940WP39_9BACI|nr:YesL family protein [Bacillus suaedae]MBP3949940.1 DUF624 domain-containing protein [Bacillus suaedae]